MVFASLEHSLDWSDKLGHVIGSTSSSGNNPDEHLPSV